MTAFVKEQYELFIQDKITCEQFRERVWKFANFLSLTPEIWMFVPCKLVDGVWVVLELPKVCICTDLCSLCKEYKLAKERCYFEGFEVKDGLSICDEHSILHIFWNYEGKWKLSQGLKTIEDLIPYNLTLTATAQKEIGL